MGGCFSSKEARPAATKSARKGDYEIDTETSPRRMVRKMQQALEELSPLPRRLVNALSPRRKRQAKQSLLKAKQAQEQTEDYPQEPFDVKVNCGSDRVLVVPGLRRHDKVLDIRKKLANLDGVTEEEAKAQFFCWYQLMEDDHYLQDYDIPWNGTTILISAKQFMPAAP